nr:hypothetical protein [uncultured Capnocytophaga sp.]
MFHIAKVENNDELRMTNDENLLSLPHSKASEEEFKKRNYYNIPDFKQVWEDTRYGGRWKPGMPE